ncbi:NAD(P)/FAD-dependent oxidoreductase [Coraliomargarita akajimensis]|uniref:FAD dependent oxidoreductase n=1 Tax=Coraliomargarita akajimensis (strain DSM 45221 / IAM 15411 / JCM 23193 / KCTC 12865 / 04OKA010-24) TaxID=583355 RepID=D5EMK4_CORAD|nr:FAD-dependent oxidoreductase [Coraliomargarita akajimensis]ADE53410.1 FAD dependent oxidoreductase [Coraliomargarita akajimensis DSM 45221]
MVDIILPLEDSENPSAQKQAVSNKLNIPQQRIIDIRLRKHSIDARQKQIKVQLRLEVGIDSALPVEELPQAAYAQLPASAPTVIIVGCGPAGMFAALECIEQGYRPILLERGKDASARRFDLGPILKQGTVIEDSNYCFGEGGAGTFSDGKLYTRATKRGPVRKIYETLVAHGAPQRILIDAHPHIGSNLLPKVVMAMRESIRKAGGEVHFQTKVGDFEIESGQIRGVTTVDGRSFRSDRVILATGHSARDIYRQLHEQGVRLEQKPFAVGVRIEHPQPLIDSLQYHSERDQPRHELLPAASYRLATKIDGRGVHSFCMCPGGFIVPAATENDEIVVNGMSLARRDSPFANSGMVVTVEPEDTADLQAEHGVLAGIAFQKALEQSAKSHGGGGQIAPGQRVTDFLKGRDSSDLPDTSYFPGIVAARIDELLPQWITDRLRRGLKLFGQQMRGYITQECNLIGFETRTSSPLRIPRQPETLQHPEVAGLYPCGEGAGYAGGIVSAALDGIRCAQAATQS